MNNSITINNIKNIKQLIFNLPKRGVYILTGKNGSGKTTLLAALHRIGFNNAFAHSFRTTNLSNNIDNYHNASIVYSVNDDQVSYAYSNTRWAPTPRKNASLLQNFGYPEVKFIAANSNRIEPTQHEIKSNNKIKVSDNICNAMTDILSNEKFRDLVFINTKRGRSNRAYLIDHKKGSKKSICYSEKNFSLGELCTLRLLISLDEIENDSLVLIDEIEMALHPKAQLALYDHLKNIAENKKLTIIFSTHSASIIKYVPRDNILLLKNNGEGCISCESKVYPAQALGQLAYDDQISPDFIFFVEDDMAKSLLSMMIERYKIIACNGRTTPIYQIMPIGGFKNVISFLENSTSLFSSAISRYAFLDEDVKTESISEAEENKKYDFLLLVENNKEKLRFLPCTPEVGLIELLTNSTLAHQENLENEYKYIRFELDRIFRSKKFKDLKKDKERDLAKSRVNFIINDINSRNTDIKKERIANILFSYYVLCHYKENNYFDLKALLGPILK